MFQDTLGLKGFQERRRFEEAQETLAPQALQALQAPRDLWVRQSWDPRANRAPQEILDPLAYRENEVYKACRS